MTDIARREAALAEVARQAVETAGWRERLSVLRTTPICDLSREQSRELARLLDLEADSPTEPEWWHDY